jgi:hypothetical protein
VVVGQGPAVGLANPAVEVGDLGESRAVAQVALG